MQRSPNVPETLIGSVLTKAVTMYDFISLTFERLNINKFKYQEKKRVQPNVLIWVLNI